jgi:hypothetical protein
MPKSSVLVLRSWIDGRACSLAQLKQRQGKDRIRGSGIARLRATRLGREGKL